MVNDSSSEFLSPVYLTVIPLSEEQADSGNIAFDLVGGIKSTTTGTIVLRPRSEECGSLRHVPNELMANCNLRQRMDKVNSKLGCWFGLLEFNVSLSQ